MTQTPSTPVPAGQSGWWDSNPHALRRLLGRQESYQLDNTRARETQAAPQSARTYKSQSTNHILSSSQVRPLIWRMAARCALLSHPSLGHPLVLKIAKANWWSRGLAPPSPLAVNLEARIDDLGRVVKKILLPMKTHPLPLVSVVALEHRGHRRLPIKPDSRRAGDF